MGYWNMSVEVANVETPKASFEKFRQRMVSDMKTRIFKLWALPIAASIALLVVGTGFIYFFMKGSLAVEYYTYTCQDSNYQLMLPDSTSVYLNKDSRITYSNRYGKKNRQVELLGEAFFDVRKNESPFLLDIANTGTTIEVLGTRFNVQAHGDEQEIVATLEEGSILFKDGKQQVMLSPNQQLIYNKKTLVLNLQDVDADIYTAWKDDIYRYSRISLQELCVELERIYGVEISVNQQLKDIKVSGSFEYRQSLEDVLNVMKKSIAFEWKRNENKVIVYR